MKIKPTNEQLNIELHDCLREFFKTSDRLSDQIADRIQGLQSRSKNGTARALQNYMEAQTALNSTILELRDLATHAGFDESEQGNGLKMLDQCNHEVVDEFIDMLTDSIGLLGERHSETLLLVGDSFCDLVKCTVRINKTWKLLVKTSTKGSDHSGE